MDLSQQSLQSHGKLFSKFELVVVELLTKNIQRITRFEY